MNLRGGAGEAERDPIQLEPPRERVEPPLRDGGGAPLGPGECARYSPSGTLNKTLNMAVGPTFDCDRTIMAATNQS